MTYVVRRFDDGRLALIADNRGPGDVDADVGRNLQLHGVVADLGDRAEQPARGDDLVADLECVEEFLDLLLPVLHRQQDHEIEDREDQRERNELDQRAHLLTGCAANASSIPKRGSVGVMKSTRGG